MEKFQPRGPKVGTVAESPSTVEVTDAKLAVAANDASAKYNLDWRQLVDRVNRAVTYRNKYPSTGIKDACDAVLANDFRGNLTDGQKKERAAFSRAMKAVLNELEPA